MNRRHSPSHVSVDIHLMVGNVSRDKNEIMISPKVKVKNQ